MKQMLEVGTERQPLARDTGTPSKWLLMGRGQELCAQVSLLFHAQTFWRSFGLCFLGHRPRSFEPQHQRAGGFEISGAT